MPQTVPMGFEFENLTSEPTRTLNGGSDGLSPILAGQVNDAFEAVLADIADLSSRLTAAEAALAASRWRHITSGQGSADHNVLIVPAGFEMLRLTVTGDFTAEGTLLLRINDDTSSNYVTGRIAWDQDPDGPFVQDFDWSDDSAWDISQWSSVESNNVIVDIFPTDGRANPSFRAYGGRMGTSGLAHTIDFATGKYQGDVVVSSLDLFAPVVGGFAAVSWWLEGFLAAP